MSNKWNKKVIVKYKIAILKHELSTKFVNYLSDKGIEADCKYRISSGETGSLPYHLIFFDYEKNNLLQELTNHYQNYYDNVYNTPVVAMDFKMVSQKVKEFLGE